MTEIKGLVSDFGGVLTTPLMTAFMALQDGIGITPEHFGTALRALTEEDGENPLYKLERGEMAEVEFLERLAQGLEPVIEHTPEMHRFRELFIGTLEPNPPMIDLMRELKDGGLRMAMLTNNVREWEPIWRAMLPVDEIFELVVDSAFVGHRKPEAEIYQLTLERFGLPAESCIFLDDLLVNCEAATAAGMHAVHFRDNDQATADLRAALA